MRGCTDILYETPLEQDACAGYDKKDTPLFPKGAPVGYSSRKSNNKNWRLETSLLLFPLPFVPRALSFFLLHFP